MMFALAACNNDDDETNHDGVDTGVVVDRSRKSVTILEDDGERDSHRVSKSTSRKCSVGERWPACKN
jgi:hypothetical protein